MKKTTTRIANMLVGMSILLGGCEINNSIVSSSNVTTQERFVQDYSGIEVSSAFLVDVEYSDTEESIIIETNENLLEYIEIEKVNGVLRIKIRNHINIRGVSTFKAHIKTKNYLSSFSASEASRITLVNSQVSTDVIVSLSGASFLRGTITANSITAFVDGASNAAINGSADTFNLRADGASLAGSFDIIAQNTIIRLSGASKASVTVNGNIDLKASGASVLTYKGTASVSHLDLSGSSQIVNAN